MKKILLSLGLMALASKGIAQTTITSANFNPVAGDVIQMLVASDSLSTLGGNGNNQTWNYSSLAGKTNYALQEEKWVSPTGTPKQSYFNGDICRYDTLSGYYYYKADATGLYYLGMCSTTGTNGTVKSNAAPNLRYPVTATTNYTDNINEADLDFVTNDHSETTGNQTVQSVGSGTLILPGGSFHNVLKVVRTRTDTLRYHGSFVRATKTIYTMWLYPGIHGEVLYNMEYNSYTTSGSTKRYYSGYTNKSPLALNDIVKKNYEFNCYPNPAQNIVNLRFSLKEDADVTVNICSIKGDVVHSVNKGRIQKGDNVSLPVDISMLAAGVYMVDANFSGVHVYQQIVKQ